MVGGQRSRQQSMVLFESLRRFVPDDHLLVRVDRVLDLSWVRDEVAHLYSEDRGRPSIDPESALRLMLAGVLLGIEHDRALIRAAQDSLAIRWFARYDLDVPLPEHSSLTRIRQRWGEALFEKMLSRTVEQCIEAGLVGGSTVHVDATLVRANASLSSFVDEPVAAAKAATAEAPGEGGGSIASEASPTAAPTDPSNPAGADHGDRPASAGNAGPSVEAEGSGAPDTPPMVVPSDPAPATPDGPAPAEAPDAVAGAEGGGAVAGGSEGKPSGKTQTKRRSRSDPDARLARKKKGEPCVPAYKVHTVCDDEQGVVLDVRVTRADVAEGHELLSQLEAASARTGIGVGVVVADAGYGHARNYAELEKRGCTAVIPSQAPSRHRGGMATSRFKHDANHDVVRCLRGAKLTRCRENEEGVTYKARVSDCSGCDLRARCVPPKSTVRSVQIVRGHDALVRARRAQWRGEIRGTAMYSRRFFLAEGVFAWAKRELCLSRAARRGLEGVTIQATLAFAAMNLRRLAGNAAALGAICALLKRLLAPLTPITEATGARRLVWPSANRECALAA